MEEGGARWRGGRGQMMAHLHKHTHTHEHMPHDYNLLEDIGVQWGEG